MSLEKALDSVGATCVKVEDKGKQRVLHLRIHADSTEMWAAMIGRYLPAIAESPSCIVDLSKYFYAENGSVKFLWRLVLAGDMKEAAEIFVKQARSLTQPVVELDSQPLVGRISYEHNPAAGKIKGAYAGGSGEALVTSTGRSR